MNFNNRNFIRGLVLMAIALLFGLVSQQNYSIGQFSRSGPGLFPLMVSSILFLIGLITVVRSRFVERPTTSNSTSRTSPSSWQACAPSRWYPNTST